jgi:hypothetical protein
MKVKPLAAVTAALTTVLASVLIIGTAQADTTDPCVPQDAWTETIVHPAVTHEETVVVVDEEAWSETIPGTPAQHYSWTGGRLDVDSPPTEVPPSDNWQANTEQEPHDNGQGNPATWVNASLHYTANSQGHASWFYFTEGTPDLVIDHPPVTHEETITVVDEEEWTEVIEHPAVPCDPPVDCPELDVPTTDLFSSPRPIVGDCGETDGPPPFHPVPEEPSRGIGTPTQETAKPAVPTVVSAGL